jgi:hypothetical protein
VRACGPRRWHSLLARTVAAAGRRAWLAAAQSSSFTAAVGVCQANADVQLPPSCAGLARPCRSIERRIGNSTFTHGSTTRPMMYRALEHEQRLPGVVPLVSHTHYVRAPRCFAFWTQQTCSAVTHTLISSACDGGVWRAYRMTAPSLACALH